LKFFVGGKKIFKKKKYFLETTIGKSRKISKIDLSKKSLFWSSARFFHMLAITMIYGNASRKLKKFFYRILKCKIFLMKYRSFKNKLRESSSLMGITMKKMTPIFVQF